MGECVLSTEFIDLDIKDVFGVVYAPHKTFKKIARNPKYLAVAVIVVLFVALQTTFYYNYYSKLYYEQTLPSADKLNAFVSANATQWVVPQGVFVRENVNDYINQTFYGNSSLQFVLTPSNSLSVALEQFGYTANCGSEGFTSLSMSVKQLTVNAASGDAVSSLPIVAPKSGILTLYTANGTSNYFTLDITSMLTRNVGEWNNLTIPVGTSEWQSTGTPDWSEITGLKLDLTYSESLSVNVLLQGIFFRGQYLTQVNTLGAGTFFGFVAYSNVMQVLAQWIILTAVIYLLLKFLKVSNVVWRPLFVTIGFTLMAIVIISAVALLSSFLLQTVYYPYDFPPFGSIVYPDVIVNEASLSSQMAYESIVASTATYTTLATAINLCMYVFLGALVTFAIKAISGVPYVKTVLSSDPENPEVTNEHIEVSELSYVKSLIIAVLAVLLSTLILAFLSVVLGIF
jgi:hypothetical protein